MCANLSKRYRKPHARNLRLSCSWMRQRNLYLRAREAPVFVLNGICFLLFHFFMVFILIGYCKCEDGKVLVVRSTMPSSETLTSIIYFYFVVSYSLQSSV